MALRSNGNGKHNGKALSKTNGKRAHVSKPSVRARPNNQRSLMHAAAPGHRSKIAKVAGIPVCGADLGVTGHSCTREAGWGVHGSYGKGPCKEHTREAVERREAIKGAFLEQMQNQPMTVRHACEKASTSVGVIWRLRKEDAVFDEAVKRMLDDVDDQRDQIVEDATFVRAADATVNSDTLRIFYLQNRRAKKWQDRRTLNHAGATDDQPIRVQTEKQFITFGGRVLVFGGSR